MQKEPRKDDESKGRIYALIKISEIFSIRLISEFIDR